MSIQDDIATVKSVLNIRFGKFDVTRLLYLCAAAEKLAAFAQSTLSVDRSAQNLVDSLYPKLLGPFPMDVKPTREGWYLGHLGGNYPRLLQFRGGEWCENEFLYRTWFGLSGRVE